MTDYKRGDERIWRVCDVDGPRTSWREAGEIVRCKDCAHGTLSHQRGVLVVECETELAYRDPDGYCHLGEREERR